MSQRDPIPPEMEELVPRGRFSRLGELRVALGVLAVVLVLEAGTRLAAPALSGNIAHIAEIDEIADSLSRASGTRILLLGNSLTNNAVDTQLVGSALERDLARRVAVAKVVPDQTSLWEWHWVMRRLVAADHAPDVVVVGFAWDQVDDGCRPNPDYLAGFFCGPSGLSWLRSHGMRSAAQLGEFLAASVSQVYATRAAIRHRILRPIVPHYELNAQTLNDEQRARTSAAAAKNQATFRRLEAFASLLRSRSTRGVFIAMPVVGSYELDPALPAALEEAGATFLDYRRLPEIENRHFEDPIHLNAEGRTAFSTVLSRDLASLLSD